MNIDDRKTNVMAMSVMYPNCERDGKFEVDNENKGIESPLGSMECNQGFFSTFKTA